MKLTKAQREVLEELKKEGGRAMYMPYMGRFNPNPYWFLSRSHRKCTRQIEKLLELGLVKRSELDKESAVITEGGMSA